MKNTKVAPIMVNKWTSDNHKIPTQTDHIATEP